MDKWTGKVAVVTGASSGIGAAIAEALVYHGLTVVGLARREDRMKELSKKLDKFPGKLIPIKTDLRNENDILAAFKTVEKEFGGADVLVNNSGLAEFGRFSEGTTAKWREILDVNVLAVCICSQVFIKSALKRKIERGHIFNISSVLGHQVEGGRGTVYTASKHAVTAIGKCLRRELAEENTNTIKVTNISPGFTRSEIVAGTLAEFLFESVPVMEGKDVAEAVITALSASPVTQICEMVMTPVPNKLGVY